MIGWQGPVATEGPRPVAVAERTWRNGCAACGPAEEGIGRATAGRQTS